MSRNRRQYTAEFKTKVVLQMLTGEKTSAEICRSHKLHASVLNRWRKEFLEQASTIFESDSEHGPTNTGLPIWSDWWAN